MSAAEDSNYCIQHQTGHWACLLLGQPDVNSSATEILLTAFWDAPKELGFQRAWGACTDYGGGKLHALFVGLMNKRWDNTCAAL